MRMGRGRGFNVPLLLQYARGVRRELSLRKWQEPSSRPTGRDTGEGACAPLTRRAAGTCADGHVIISPGRWQVRFWKTSLARPGSTSIMLMQQLDWLKRV